jgi:hypothetical protein
LEVPRGDRTTFFALEFVNSLPSHLWTVSGARLFLSRFGALGRQQAKWSAMYRMLGSGFELIEPEGSLQLLEWVREEIRAECSSITRSEEGPLRFKAAELCNLLGLCNRMAWEGEHIRHSAIPGLLWSVFREFAEPLSAVSMEDLLIVLADRLIVVEQELPADTPCLLEIFFQLFLSTEFQGSQAIRFIHEVLRRNSGQQPAIQCIIEDKLLDAFCYLIYFPGLLEPHQMAILSNLCLLLQQLVLTSVQPLADTVS